MNIFVTGESGFISRNLIELINKYKKHSVVNDKIKKENSNISLYENIFLNHKNKEIDFVKIDYECLKKYLSDYSVNLIVHSGAIVGTDVVSMNSKESIETNVYGTFRLAKIASELKIPIIYIGTTVIYDTQKFQSEYITEKSSIFPRTLYATTKYEGELIVKAYCEKSKYSIIRPLFCYGGIGDMNSLVAKSIFNIMSGRRKNINIFLDKNKYKDYMHVEDFVMSIYRIIENKTYELNKDFNVSSMNPIRTDNIVSSISSILNEDVDKYITWYPEKDYLGNHMVDSCEFLKFNHFKPQIKLNKGIEKFISYFKNSPYNYNPLSYEESTKYNINDVLKSYNYGE